MERLKFKWMCIWTQANKATWVMSNYLSWGESLSCWSLSLTRMCEKLLWNMEKMKSAPCMRLCPLSIITAPPTGSQACFGETECVCLVLGASGDALRFPLHPPERSEGQCLCAWGHWGHSLMRIWAAGGLWKMLEVLGWDLWYPWDTVTPDTCLQALVLCSVTWE